MTKEEIRYIAEDLLTELREMEDGSITTTRDLLNQTGFDHDDCSIEDLVEIHQTLLDMAEANNIKLDYVSDTMALISPIGLEYKVCNKDAQIKCPFCGSINTARIIYGMPALSLIEEKLKEGKVILGGDDIEGDNLPARKCNECGREF